MKIPAMKCVLSVLACLTAGPLFAASCDSLASLALPETTITMAQLVPAGQFSAPFVVFAPFSHIVAQSISVPAGYLVPPNVWALLRPGRYTFASITSPLVGTVCCDLMCAQAVVTVVG